MIIVEFLYTITKIVMGPGSLAVPIYYSWYSSFVRLSFCNVRWGSDWAVGSVP